MVRNLNCVCWSVVVFIIIWKNGWCYDEYFVVVLICYLYFKGKGVDVMSNDKLKGKDKIYILDLKMVKNLF